MSQNSPPAFNTTPTVLILIAVNVGIHLVRLLLPGNWDEMIGILGAFSPPYFLSVIMGEGNVLGFILLLSPISSGFLHGDLLHLVINMAFLLAFGTAIERRLGRVRFLGLYFACMLAGAGASMGLFFITLEQTFMVGASGAISGLFGAVLRMTMARAYVAIAVFVGLNVIIGYTGMPSMGEVRAIAWEAHIGGLIAGFLLMPLFDRKVGQLTPGKR
ncbi:MAG: rhomboid family intramembrane serine protease [Alphaproteobacteria bacterium]